MKTRLALFLALFFACALSCFSKQTTGDANDGYKLDSKFKEILQKAIADSRLYPERNRLRKINFDSAYKENRRAIDALAGISYPDARGLQRIRIDYVISFGSSFEKRFTHVWLVSESEDELVIINNFFERTTFPKKPNNYLTYIGYSNADFRGELREALKHDDFDYWFYLQFTGRTSGGSVWDRCFNLAVFASQFGYYKEADELIRFGIKEEGDFIAQVAIGYASQDLLNATYELYEHGHASAIPYLKHVVENFRFTKYGDQAEDLLNGCTKVIESKSKWSQENPATLNPTERAKYWAERLPDLKGMQMSDPGSPQFFALWDTEKLPADELVQIGRPALPVLMEYLDDDRPTRSIYFGRSFYPEHYAAKVGDAALVCIERITGEKFYERSSSSSFLYNDKPGVKETVIANVKKWWNAHKDEL